VQLLIRACAGKNNPDTFLKANGGKMATCEEAIKAAHEDMEANTKVIRE
jgi:hypothetical protein